MSVWNYVRRELVQVDENNYTDLHEYIINSTSYNKSVQSTIEKAKDVINDRVHKYAFLLCVYVYEDVYEFLSSHYWDIFRKAFQTLITAEMRLRREKKKIGTLKKVWGTLRLLKDDKSTRRSILDLIKVYTEMFLTTKEYEKISFEISEDTKSFESNTHILPLEVLRKLFEEFPKFHGYDTCYDFHKIPFEPIGIQNHIIRICELVEIEFSSILSIE